MFLNMTKSISVLFLMLITGSVVAMELSALDIQRGFGAAGDLVFQVVSGATKTSCVMDSTVVANIVVDVGPSSGCSNYRIEPGHGTTTLQGGSVYHISGAALQTAYTAHGCTPYATNIQYTLSRVFCNGPGGLFSAVSISPSLWLVSCNGTSCTTSSSVITVTLP